MSSARASTALAIVALLLAIGSIGYVSISLQGVSSGVADVRAELGKEIDSLKGEVSSLAEELRLIAQAAGIESLEEAKMIIEERRQLEARISAAKAEGGLVIYGSVDTEDIQPLLDAFEERYGIKVTYEHLIPPVIYKRVTSEIRANKPTADAVLVSQSIMGRIAMEGLLRRYVSPEAEALLDKFKDPEGRWAGAVQLAYVIAYNTQNVRAEELPKTLAELADPKWRGRVVMHNILLGTSGTQYLASLMRAVGEEKLTSFLKEFARNVEPVLERGLSAIADKVAAGEYDIGFIALLHDVVRLKELGAPIDFFLPEDVPLLSSIASIGILKQARHPVSAELFVDFILSKEGQVILGNTPVRIPARLDVQARYALDRIMPGAEPVFFPTPDIVANAKEWAQRFRDMGFG